MIQMANSYFTIKALTTVALLFFTYKMFDCMVDAINIVWSVEDYEDLDTED